MWKEQEMWICNRKLYRTKDGKLVEESDPRAEVLLFSPGDVLANEPVTSPPAPPLKGDGSEKAVKPVEDKAVKPAADKKRKGKAK
jgi:hypothetical protein